MANWKKYSNEANEEQKLPSSIDTDLANSDNNNQFKVATWILSGLLIMALIGAGVFFTKNNALQDRTAELNTTVSDLDEMKQQLETDLADLEGNYNTTIDENEDLKATIEERVAEIEILQTKIRQVRNQLKNSEMQSGKMQERLAQLESLKESLQADVANLKGENKELIVARDELTTTLEQSRNEIIGLSDQIVELTQMNQKMENRLYRTAPAGFTAGNFSVDIEKNNDKVTAKARQAREIKVNFDLPYVPVEKQGETELYLVVTDIYGNPVQSTTTSSVKVPTPQDDLKVEVVDIDKVNLKESQAIAMSFEPEDKMAAGEYHLMVYSDEGYLGSTGFKLR